MERRAFVAHGWSYISSHLRVHAIVSTCTGSSWDLSCVHQRKYLGILTTLPKATSSDVRYCTIFCNGSSINSSLYVESIIPKVTTFHHCYWQLAVIRKLLCVSNVVVVTCCISWHVPGPIVSTWKHKRFCRYIRRCLVNKLFWNIP